MKQFRIFLIVILIIIGAILLVYQIAKSQEKQDTTLSRIKLYELLSERKEALVKQKDEIEKEILRIDGQLVLLGNLKQDSLTVNK